MNDTTAIPSYSQHNFSSLKLCLWSRLWRFILVNPLPFALDIVIKHPFAVTFNDVLEKQVISQTLKEDLSLWICNLPHSSSLEYEECKFPACSLFLSFSSGSRLWIGNVLKLCKFSSTFVQIAFHLFSSWSDEGSDLGSSLYDVSMVNQFWT